MIELGPGEKAFLSLQLPAEFVLIFDAVTHSTQFIDVKGEPTHERQNLAMVISQACPERDADLASGPLRLALENHTNVRVMPNVCVVGDDLHEVMSHRRPFLTAKRLLTNQTFRDIYRTNTIDIDQRLKITSLTFLFTDLRGSTPLRARRRPCRLRPRAGALPGPQRDRRRRSRRRRQDHRRCRDGDLPDAGPGRRRRPGGCARRCTVSMSSAGARTSS